MNINPNFFKAETRSGHFVDEKMKKVWAIELELLEQFDSVCKKHNLRYFADYGTLLGAVRHNGFIPWDDDIDVVMFRDDYTKLKSIAEKEFTSPLFFQNIYTDPRRLIAFSKLCNSNTSAIEYPDISADTFNQGIFIDIIPYDDVFDDISIYKSATYFQLQIWATIRHPQESAGYFNSDSCRDPNRSFFKELLGTHPVVRFKLFEDMCLEQCGKSTLVNIITDTFSIYKPVKREWFSETVYLPFENFMIPCPKEYEKVLTAHFGTWQKPVKGLSAHEGIIFEPDIPYSEILPLKI